MENDLVDVTIALSGSWLLSNDQIEGMINTNTHTEVTVALKNAGLPPKKIKKNMASIKRKGLH